MGIYSAIRTAKERSFWSARGAQYGWYDPSANVSAADFYLVKSVEVTVAGSRAVSLARASGPYCLDISSRDDVRVYL